MIVVDYLEVLMWVLIIRHLTMKQWGKLRCVYVHKATLICSFRTGNWVM